ncbi:hypothetical protein FACS189413_05070 [Bacteroidia bacterium]|nr:hypothetical protein FACS189413_05070 [Bacteroidia bacterium]
MPLETEGPDSITIVRKYIHLQSIGNKTYTGTIDSIMWNIKLSSSELILYQDFLLGSNSYRK